MPTAATAVAHEIRDPLLQERAVDGLLHSLLGEDPVTAQKATCDAISGIVGSDQPTPAELDALLSLELHAQQTSGELLKRYVDGDGALRAFNLQDWIAALRLSKKFYQGYERMLRHTQQTSDHYWLAHAHFVVVRMFHHRQVEFLLRFIRFKKRIPGQWKEIHEAYKYALMRGIAMHSIAGDDDSREAATTLEQQYIRLLLLEVINNGQFAPRDALWADAWFSRWARMLRLEWRETNGGVRITNRGFVVDIDGTDGLRRTGTVTPRNPLHLDPTPLQALFDKELATLTSAEASHDASTHAERAGKIALLRKLSGIYAPVSVRVIRRGEREPVALSIQMVTGLSSIIQILREEAGRHAAPAAMAEPRAEEIAVSPLGLSTDFPAMPTTDGAGLARTTGGGPSATAQQAWQLRDRSESGARLRGQIDDLNRIIPGSLVAIRERADAPWTISVVRRFRRLMVNFVEIGVEHLGRRPSVVKIVAKPSAQGSAPGEYANGRFVALYLPPSESQPVMPIRTLLLPARKFDADGRITLLSSNSTHTLRLNEPIQQQFEYLWASFTVVDSGSIAEGAKAVAAAHP